MQKASLQHIATLLGLALCLLVSGCSNKPSRVRAPKFDVNQATDELMSALDTNDDGSLDKSETKSCPGILDDWGTYDTDNNDKISSAEVSSRFQVWRESDTGLTNIRCEVTWGGQPLKEADIRMEPVPMLGANFYAASGTTDRYGFAFMNVEDAPASLAGTFGMQLGLYSVRITHPSVDIPAKYNEETTLGVDLSAADGNNGVTFHLTP